MSNEIIVLSLPGKISVPIEVELSNSVYIISVSEESVFRVLSSENKFVGNLTINAKQFDIKRVDRLKIDVIVLSRFSINFCENTM